MRSSSVTRAPVRACRLLTSRLTAPRSEPLHPSGSAGPGGRICSTAGPLSPRSVALPHHLWPHMFLMPIRARSRPSGGRYRSPTHGDRRTIARMTPEEIADLGYLRQARDLIDRHYAQPLDVPAMARTALMSPAHFSRKFRAAYGETPYSYLMTRRMERAKALLRQGMSVTDTCVAVGCTSLAHSARASRRSSARRRLGTARAITATSRSFRRARAWSRRDRAVPRSRSERGRPAPSRIGEAPDASTLI